MHWKDKNSRLYFTNLCCTSMSEDKFENNVFKYVSHSSISLKEKTYELQTSREEDKEFYPAQADDALDDSSSSYCTALCSLSEYSEALEEETQTTCPDTPCKNILSETIPFVAVSGSPVTNSLPEKTEDSTKTLSFLSNPKITVLNINLININSADATQDTIPTSTSNPTTWDYLKSKQYAAQTDTNPVQNVESPNHKKMTQNTVSNMGKGRYQQKRNQEHENSAAEKDPTTFPESIGNAHPKPDTVRLDSGKSIISEMKWKGEERGIGVGEEQAEQSLNTGNRKPSGCTSTLTAIKQKSGILPRCYSKRSLTTINQHQSQSPPIFRRLKKQHEQGIDLSTLLPPTPCNSTRQHCSSAENTKEKFGMASRVIGKTTGAGGLAALEYTRTSCPETNYLDVFNSSCWSSTQLSSDKYCYNWSKDVLSFETPMISTNNNNTSACSESSSFECIDVALENHKEVNRNTKTVPKRKIQLKRRDNAEHHANEKDNTQSTPSWPRDTIQRQHSTPAAFHQSSHGSETKSGPTEQRQKLQKSVSLDETFSKTKMASCIIKNILLKRMQHEQNFHSVDIPDQTFCAIKTDGKANNIDCLTSCVKEECTEINEGNLATVSLIGSHADFQTDSQTISSIKEHISVSSKILPKLTSKHSFNPLLGGVGRTQFQESCTEIAACSETEKKEKLNPSKEGTGEKLSCDSAKGKTWNLSAVSSGAVGKQARVKSTPEECVNAQAAQQQHCVKKQNVEKQEIPGEKIENTQSLYANIVDKVLPRSALCNLRKGQQNGEGELRPLGQSVNMGIQSQGKFKAIAPVHVVRDMRSLVKNTYSLSFRGPTEAVQELDVLSFATAGTHPVIGKRENKVTGHKQKKKLHVPTLPLALDRNIDALSLENTSSECSSKTRSILESNDKIPYTGFTKVSPISAAQTNSCALSNSQEAQNSTTATSQTNVQHSNKYTKKATCSRKQIHKGTFINTYKNEQLADSKNPECEKPLYLMQPFTSASLYLSPTQTSDKQGGFKPSDQVCPAQKDGEQSSGLPAKSQGSAGPPCILTVAPAPVFPSYFYKTNVLSYQTLSPNMGTVSYVQGPVLLQTPPYKLAASASGSIPLKKTLSVEESLLSQPYTTDGYPVPQESSKQMENGDTSQKMSYPDTQPCSAFITTLGAEGIHGGASILYPETSVRQHVSNPRHRLLDPETGQCFYVDMPHLPQWKMLFDPETCQYVEVVVPQQTLPTTVLTTPCALPYPSLNIPGMYTPHACLSYVQTHQQVPPPPPPEP